MYRSRSLVTGITIAAAVGALALPAASAMADTSPSPSPSLIGGNPGTWSPINLGVKDSGKTVTLVKDQAVIFPKIAAKAKFTSSNPKVFVVSNAEGKGTYTASAGGHAVAVGTSKVTVTLKGKPIAHFTIIVKK